MFKEDIIKAWKDNGWYDLKSYTNGDHPVIKDLDPDRVDKKEFWLASEDHFGTDCISNGAEGSIEDINLRNHNLATYSGIYGFLELAIANAKKNHNCVKLMEVGVGYGSFYENVVQKRNDITCYIGTDLIKRTHYCVEIGDDGLLTSDQIIQYKDEVNVIYSFNVFQHLSKSNIEGYLKQFHEILKKGGCVVFSYANSINNYAYQYGQTVELMKIDVLIDLCSSVGFKLIAKSYLDIDGVENLNPNCFLLIKT